MRINKYINNNKFINSVLVGIGLIYFKFFKRTPSISNKALINLYCLTNGSFTENLNLKLNTKKEVNLIESNSSLFQTDSKKISDILKTLTDDGYYILEDRLSNDFINGILDIISYSECKSPDGHTMIYDEKKIKNEIYRYNVNDIISNENVQDLIVDPFLYNICSLYFNSNPIFDYASMWILNGSFNQNSKEAAQFYHFDLDRLKWLKVFVYLEDVSLTNAPHYYIKGSHKVNAKPIDLLKKGYTRISDDEMKNYYKKDDFKFIEGKKGTVIIGDTKCWHKGGFVKKGDRKILQLQFTDNLFGANVEKKKIKYSSKKIKLKNKEFNHLLQTVNLV